MVGVVDEESLEVGGGGVGVALDGLGLPCRVGVPCPGHGHLDVHGFVAGKDGDLDILHWTSLALEADDEQQGDDDDGPDHQEHGDEVEGVHVGPDVLAACAESGFAPDSS